MQNPLPFGVQTPFQLGKLLLPNNLFYAPLAGCSDFPFRRMSAKFKPGLMYCEMVKMDALVRNDQNTFHLLDFDASMHPIGAQLCGSKPSIAGKAAKMIEDLGFDVVDLNCGCPVDKVTKDGSGSGMLKTPELIGDVIASMVASVKIPVTVKIRAGWNDREINAPLITQIAEKAGAVAICVHGRTREQAYRGPANWDYIKACKDAATTISVIGNGDLFTPDAIENIYAQTRCDAFLISRGTLGQPWIVQDILDKSLNKPVEERSSSQIKQALVEHFDEMLRYLPERKAVIEMRRVGCWYFKKAGGTRSFREKISRAQSTQEIFQIIQELDFSNE